MPEPRLLPSIDAITREWLEEILAPHRASGSGSIRDFEIEPIGAGTASETRRIRLSYDEPGTGPAQLICKFPPRDAGAREASAGYDTFRREAESYALVSARAACRVPYAYRIASDGGSINLVMEDLTASARPGDQIRGCGLAEAEAVIDQLARLHRTIGPLTEADAPDWLLRMPAMAAGWGAGIRAGGELARDRFGSRFTDSGYHTARRAGSIAAAWLAAPRARLGFTHGDARVDNVLFQPQADGIEAVLIDWQMAGLRAPLYDVAYFLASSLPVPLRRQHERDLLARYAAQAGTDPERTIADYAFELLASPTLTILSIAALPRTETIDRLVATLLERNLAALEDWGSLDLIEARLTR